ncbi:hypothetical protein BDFG_05092 [Blastomyces dermatitidis ATCC 26199]|nr:hypothetical protein BDFG_05092 [Blastomyces dermatitidis ATCC 26199]
MSPPEKTRNFGPSSEEEEFSDSRVAGLKDAGEEETGFAVWLAVSQMIEMSAQMRYPAVIQAIGEVQISGSIGPQNGLIERVYKWWNQEKQHKDEDIRWDEVEWRRLRAANVCGWVSCWWAKQTFFSGLAAAIGSKPKWVSQPGLELS